MVIGKLGEDYLIVRLPDLLGDHGNPFTVTTPIETPASIEGGDPPRFSAAGRPKSCNRECTPSRWTHRELLRVRSVHILTRLCVAIRVIHRVHTTVFGNGRSTRKPPPRGHSSISYAAGDASTRRASWCRRFPLGFAWLPTERRQHSRERPVLAFPALRLAQGCYAWSCSCGRGRQGTTLQPIPFSIVRHDPVRLDPAAGGELGFTLDQAARLPS